MWTLLHKLSYMLSWSSNLGEPDNDGHVSPQLPLELEKRWFPSLRPALGGPGTSQQKTIMEYNKVKYKPGPRYMAVGDSKAGRVWEMGTQAILLVLSLAQVSETYKLVASKLTANGRINKKAVTLNQTSDWVGQGFSVSPKFIMLLVNIKKTYEKTKKK